MFHIYLYTSKCHTCSTCFAVGVHGTMGPGLINMGNCVVLFGLNILVCPTIINTYFIFTYIVLNVIHLLQLGYMVPWAQVSKHKVKILGHYIVHTKPIYYLPFSKISCLSTHIIYCHSGGVLCYRVSISKILSGIVLRYLA